MRPTLFLIYINDLCADDTLQYAPMNNDMDRLLFQTNIDALQSTKLLAYTNLCRRLVGYADTLGDPADTDSIQETEVVQNRAIRFVKNIRGRHSITETRQHLD